MMTNYKSQESIDGYLKFFFPKKIYVKKQFENLCLYAPRSCMLFVIGEGDYVTTCAFSRGCCEVSGTAIKAVSGGLPHSRKYYFLNIVKTNIQLRFKESMINFYFYYFNCLFTWSNCEIHRKTQMGHRACAKNNCTI